MCCKKNGGFPPSLDRVMEASIRRLTSRAVNSPDSGDSVFACVFGAHTTVCRYTIIDFWELYVPRKMWYRGRDIRRDISHNRVWGPALPCKISLARRHASIEKMQRAEMPSSRAVACRREDHIDAHLGG